MLITLRYQDELRPTSGIELPADRPQGGGRRRQGGRACQAAGRRHDGALESRRVQGHLPRRPHGPHQAEDQGRARPRRSPKREKGEEGAPRSAQVIDLAELLQARASARRPAPRKAARKVLRARARSRRCASWAAPRPPAKRVAKIGVQARGAAQARVTSARRHAMALETYRAKRNFRRTPEPRGARRARKAPGAVVRHPEARGESPALRLPPRARRRAAELGGAEGTEPRSRRQAPRDARRGSPARVRRIRRRHSRKASTAAAP